jgi:4-amino-4-deoxy-L-arabinose transferase-like glycosyltransferase
MSVNGRYGYHRDELYFLACGRHPAWGYPDQPPLTPTLAALFDTLGRGSLTVFRVPCLAAVLGSCLVAALIARELGGGRRAQILTLAATLLGTFPLLFGHILLTSTPDLPVWVTLTWLVLRITRTGNVRLWPLVGVVLGIGLVNKQLVLVLVLGLTVGMLFVPDGRRLIGNRWFAGAAAIALIAWAPIVLWQARHGWPQLTISREIRAEYGAAGQRVGLLALQLLLFSLGATVLWVVGGIQLWRDPRWRFARVLPVAWLFVFAVFVIVAGQGYYTAGLYPALIAAGAVVVERRRRTFLALAVGVFVTSLLTMPAALPLLSPSALANSPWSGLAETQLETVGWPMFVAKVDLAVRSLPVRDQADAEIMTANYGEAGAIQRWGPAIGLPEAYSRQNGFGLWGPPAAGRRPVVVVWEDGAPTAYFSGCERFVRVGGPVPNEEQERAAIYTCSGPRGGWAHLWPRLVHLSS